MRGPYLRRKVRIGGKVNYYRRRLGRGPAAAARMRLGRRYNPTPTFTETFLADPITFNATSPGSTVSLLQNSFSQISQIAQYTALYNQYCIRKITAIFVPAYNVYDQPALGSSVTAAPRFVWAIQDSAQQATPAAESDVLQDNGAKIRMFTKPIKISWRPRAAAADALVAGGFAAITRRGPQWYSCNTSTAVPHNGLAYAFTNDNPITGNPVLAQVYIKMTFSLRDPK